MEDLHELTDTIEQIYQMVYDIDTGQFKGTLVDIVQLQRDIVEAVEDLSKVSTNLMIQHTKLYTCYKTVNP